MAAADKFSRFGDKRKITSDTQSYDDYVEGVEADEVTSLETPLPEDNRGFKLIKLMGWNSGTGLGKYRQGRKDPVPFELKDDHMGLGRWTMELEQAQETTERRRQLEVEKELTEDLMEQYKVQAEKDKKLLDTLTEMNKSFYCELCDRQYTKYSEYENHINSYSHHHQQRLRSLKDYETGRRFGGHRSTEQEKEKMLAAQMVAMERAQMRIKQQKKQLQSGHTPGFKPIGGGPSESKAAVPVTDIVGIKRHVSQSQGSGTSSESNGKKSKLSKYGLKFQSAGTLMSIGEQIGKDTPLVKNGEEGRGQNKDLGQKKDGVSTASSGLMSSWGTGSGSGSGNLSSKLMARYTTTKWDKEGDFEKRLREAQEKDHAIRVEKAPPPLKSRQKELNMENYSDSADEEEEPSLTARTIIRKPAKLKFNLAKK